MAFFILQFSFLSAQEERRPTGLILDDSATYIAITKAPEIDGSKYDIPKVKNLKKYCPEPGDQGNTGACVAWALGHGAFTICGAIRNHVADRCAITEEAYSAAYLFNHIKEGASCQVGARFSKALDFLKNKGDCLAREFDHPSDDCTYLPEVPYDDTSIDRIKNYARIFEEKDSKDEKIKRLKMAIGTDSPVIVGMDISSGFYSLTDSLWKPNVNEKTAWHHAMVAIGYNDELEEVEIMNSYGLNWGDQGFFKISYEDFSRLVRYGFQIVIDDKPLISTNESSWSLFDWLTWGSANPNNLGRGEVYFEYGATVDQYEPTTLLFDSTLNIFHNARDWSVGDFFQLRFGPHQHFVYIFSYDPISNSARWEYPNSNSSNSDQAIIRIPNNGQGFEITSPGDNYLCLLFSKEELNFSSANYLEKIEQIKGGIYKKTLEAFAIDENNMPVLSYFSDLQFTYKKENHTEDLIPIIIKFSGSD